MVSSWTLIRTLRADRPPAASRGRRRDTFSAALAQSEALWQVGGQVPPSVQPIVLFYGLTQAGRAIAAARGPEGSWEAIARHGLKTTLISMPDDTPLPFNRIEVRDNGNGFFQQIARLVGSPTLPRATSVAALALSLPEEERFLLPGDEPRPLKVTTKVRGGNVSDMDDLLEFHIGPLPNHLVRREITESRRQMMKPSPNDVRRWLTPYPKFAELGEPVEVRGFIPMDPDIRNDLYSVLVAWRLDHQLNWNEHYRYASSIYDLPDSNSGIPRSGVVLPVVGGNSAPLSPLMTWWTVLYACSMLARYHPRQWVQLLDVDTSSCAVPAASILESASTTLPRLILNELLAAYPDEAE
jgi:hypothetical protein